MRISSWLFRKGLAPIVAAIVLVGVGVCALLVFSKPWLPYKVVDKIERKLGLHEKKTVIETVLLRASIGQINVPGRAGVGGGLGTFRNDLVLLTFDGELYEVQSEGVEKLDVALPENGLKDFLALASTEQYKAYEFTPRNLTQPRFNDIDFFFSKNRLGMVVAYTEWRPELQCYNTAVAVLDISAEVQDISTVTARSDDWSVVFRTEPCLPLKKQNKAIESQMAGSRIAVVDSRTMYLASGDYHWDSTHHPETLADKPDNHYGKVIEIDLESGSAEVVAKGFRNPQGITYDSSGGLWTLEHGPRGGDELNLVKPGGDYGWPFDTLGTASAMTPWPLALDYGRHDQSTSPVYAWLPSIGASNLTVIRGFHPGWEGDLLAASLKAQSLFRIRLHENRVIYAEQIRIGERIRYVHQHSDGSLYLWTDSARINVLYNPETYAPAAKLKSKISRLNLGDQNLEAQLLETITDCMGCHSFDNNVENSTAPSLLGLYGRRIGAGNFRYYSDNFRYRLKGWNEERLKSFLRNPEKTIPGVRMPDPGIEDEKLLDALVALIKEY